MQRASDAFASAVLPMLAELEASANARDTDRHMAAYARDPALTFVFDGRIVRGWEALRELQRQWWSDTTVRGSYAYLGDPVLQALGEDLGLTTVLIAARKEAADGSVVERRLAWSAVWRRLDEGWRVVFAHESSDR